MTHSSSYLYRRPSGWYCCINIPVDIRHYFNQSQLRYPLGTQRISSAKHRAMYLATHCRELFNSLRAGDMKSFNEEDIKLLVAQWLREALDLSDEARIEHSPYHSEAQAEEKRDLEKFERSYRNALGRRDYSSVEAQAERILQEADMLSTGIVSPLKNSAGNWSGLGSCLPRPNRSGPKGNLMRNCLRYHLLPSLLRLLCLPRNNSELPTVH